MTIRAGATEQTAPAPPASDGSLIVARGLTKRFGDLVAVDAIDFEVVYRHGFLVLFSGFFEPLFYLFALGTGLHRLVGTVLGPGGQPISYTAFIAPALLASSAMNGAVYDATLNVFHKIKHDKLYEAMLATSLGPLDVAIGEIGWR